MTAFSPERCAAALLGARRVPRAVRIPLAVLPPGSRPGTLEEGIAAQVAMAQLQDQAAPAGFKIGATAARMQDYLGLTGPIAGFMPRANLFASGSTLAFAPYLNPGVECELAVHLARDLPPRPTAIDEAAAAVDLLMCGIEIVENRYQDLHAFGTPALAADQAFHAGAVLGTPTSDWREIDLAALQGAITIDGAVMGRGTGGDLLGHPMEALAWLAGSAEAAAFGGLKAGQVIMLGSVTPPVWLQGPATIEVSFPPLAPVVLTLA